MLEKIDQLRDAAKLGTARLLATWNAYPDKLRVQLQRHHGDAIQEIRAEAEDADQCHDFSHLVGG